MWFACPRSFEIDLTAESLAREATRKKLTINQAQERHGVRQRQGSVNVVIVIANLHSTG